MAQLNQKLVILVFADYYLPGFKAGGPIRTLANMLSQLEGEFHFKIVTRDRDLGDSAKYISVITEKWIKHGDHEILYVDPSKFGFLSVVDLIRNTSFDVLYLNSFFSYWATILPLFAKHLFANRAERVILAPRGEFAAGALNISRKKKLVYFKIVSILGIYNNVTWQASSTNEFQDIANCIAKYLGIQRDEMNIKIAPNLIPANEMARTNLSLLQTTVYLRIVFLSRIVPMKNLDFLIDVLSKVKDKVVLNIYGPIENQGYWELCEEKMKTFGDNVSYSYGGIVDHQDVAARLSESDVFFLPTRGENFGRIIFESMAAGVPAVISDKTSWEADPNGALTVLPLEVDLWVNEIHKWSQRSQEERNMLRQKALDYASDYSSKSDAYQKNVNLFLQNNQ